MKSFLPMLATAAIAPCAFAQDADDSGWYAGLGYEYLQEDDTSFDYGAVTVTGGLNLTPMFGVELSAATGVSGDEWFQPGEQVNDPLLGDVLTPDQRSSGDLNYRVDLMGVARVPVTSRINLIGKLGVSNWEYESTFESMNSPDFPDQHATSKTSGTGLAGSLGAEMFLTDTLSLEGAYSHYEEQGLMEDEVKGYQLRLKRRF